MSIYEFPKVQDISLFKALVAKGTDVTQEETDIMYSITNKMVKEMESHGWFSWIEETDMVVNVCHRYPNFKKHYNVLSAIRWQAAKEVCDFYNLGAEEMECLEWGIMDWTDDLSYVYPDEDEVLKLFDSLYF